ncbi:metallophosphoesterase [Desulfoplanes sp.]
MKRRFLLAVLISILSLLCLSCKIFGTDSSLDAVLITDIHFNPFSNATIARMLDQENWENWDSIFQQTIYPLSVGGNETNPALLDSVISAMRKNTSMPECVIFCGDILGHGFNETYADITGNTDAASTEKFVLKTVSYVMSKVASVYPDVPVFFTLGNNDSYAGDYLLEDGGAFLADSAAPLFEICIKDDDLRSAFMTEYSEHGHYSLDVPGEGHIRLVSLNTIFMSSRYAGSNATRSAYAELDWFEQTLRQARNENRKVWLITHIPPGIDVFGYLHGYGSCGNPPLQIKADYTERFLGILRMYSETVAAIFTGHTHMDDFRLLFPEGTRSGALEAFIISPALSPLFGQNPAFRTIDFDTSSGEIENMAVWYTSSGADVQEALWEQEYDFKDSYGLSPTPENLETIARHFQYNATLKTHYINFYYVNKKPAPIATIWKWYWCSILNIEPEYYMVDCPDCP